MSSFSPTAGLTGNAASLPPQVSPQCKETAFIPVCAPDIKQAERSAEASNKLTSEQMKKLSNILNRAKDMAHDIMDTSQGKEPQEVRVIHHYCPTYDPFWFSPFPYHSHHHHYHYDNSSSSTPRRREKENVSATVLVAGVMLFLGGTYYVVKELADKWILGEVQEKIQKDKQWVKGTIQEVSDNPQLAQTLKKVKKIVSKEQDIISRINDQANLGLCGKAGFLASGAVGIGAWFYQSEYAAWACAGGALLSTIPVLIKWGLSNAIAHKNNGDAHKIENFVLEAKDSLKI